MDFKCLECNCSISYEVNGYSIGYFGIPLCINHQKWLKQQELVSTVETISLYFELKARNVPAQLEKYDGYKHIDIAIPEARVNIEVDGGHHNYNSKQALSDLKRTYHSFLKGFLTLRIPNSLIKHHLEETADHITEMLCVNRDRVNKNKYSFKKF
ncbi:DUF559 domain-containing protein [Pedobacter sp. KR3-3]|uniref:DUF559 domain-containing protein n=1 Tax=Pedobacter albus TaxID=3113905 RepID=A0ABU7I6G5_9SPHI|nr:DUF559 domain-containing protein [Pedobacter sp. KR3-3]MEE1945072.1 DUF559 domain-containing protein [Pedobacter sp. KR3-3]